MLAHLVLVLTITGLPCGRQNGFRKIDGFKIDDIPCQIAGMIPRGDGTNGTLDLDQWVEPKEQRKVDAFILYGLIAAQMAVEDPAGLLKQKINVAVQVSCWLWYWRSSNYP